jgi:NTE family protein
MSGDGGSGQGKRVGLVLSAGGARGLAHIPVLEALDDLGIKPAIIAGTSIGALIGACYAAGMSGADLRAYVNALFRNRTEIFARIWRQKPRQVRDLFLPGALTIGQFNAQHIVQVFLPDWVPRDFAELEIPLVIVATDYYGECEAVLTQGELTRAIAASLALPVLFRPVIVDGRVMVDGGVSNPLPFDHVGSDVDIVIAADVIGGPSGPPTRPPTSIEALFGASQLLMRAVTTQKLKGRHAPDIIVRPSTNAFKVLDFMKVKSILAAAEPVKEEVKRALDRVMSA